jgi:hypothetical protein
MNKSFKVVLACAMYFAISLEGKPRALAGEESLAKISAKIIDLMMNFKTGMNVKHKENDKEEEEKIEALKNIYFIQSKSQLSLISGK